MPAANAAFRDAFHIILVEPGESLNVGAVARAMGNFGFEHLHLVAPRGYDRARAAVTACWAEPLLGRLTIHPTLDDALTGIQTAIGFSMRAGKDIPPHHITLTRWLEALPMLAEGDTVAMPQTALIFGPEENGLRLEDMARCRWVVRIPTAAECPSLNLAQSVLLVLYELAKQANESDDEAAQLEVPADLPTGNERQQVERLLDGIMDGSGFVRQGSPAHVPGVVRSLFRRLDLDKSEMGILLGLLGRVNTALCRIALTPRPPLPASARSSLPLGERGSLISLSASSGEKRSLDELPLSPRGSEERADAGRGGRGVRATNILLTAATQFELDAVFPTPLGAVVAEARVTGVGIPATFANLHLTDPLPTLLLNVGIAGAYPETGIAIGDIVLAASEIYGDIGFETGDADGFRAIADSPFGDFYREPIPTVTPPEWTCLEAQDLDFRVHVAHGCTVNTCTGTYSTGIRRRDRFGVGFETMEGAAVAQIGRAAGVPVCEIRAISNLASDRDMRPENIRLALENLRRYLETCPALAAVE